MFLNIVKFNTRLNADLTSLLIRCKTNKNVILVSNAGYKTGVGFSRVMPDSLYGNRS